MSDTRSEEPPEDNLLREELLASLLPLTDAAFGKGNEDFPELSVERMEALMAQVRSRFPRESEDSSPGDLAEGSPSDEEVPDLSPIETFLEESMPLVQGLDTESETGDVPELPAEKMDQLLAEVRKQFGTEAETETTETMEKKIIPFSRYLAPLAMAASLVVAFVVLYDGEDITPGGGGLPGGGEVQLASNIQLGDWEDEHILNRGGEDEGNETADVPSWVKKISYDDNAGRQAWLTDETIIKVWVDRSKGLIMIHRPGSAEPEEVELTEDQDERTQVMAVLEKLHQEISGVP